MAGLLALMGSGMRQSVRDMGMHPGVPRGRRKPRPRGEREHQFVSSFSARDRKEAFLTRICIDENLRRFNAKRAKLGLKAVDAIPKGCAGTLIH